MMMRSVSDSGSSAARHGYGISEEEERMLIKKGPWTEEEDSILVNYITLHGEGHWNTVAGCAGLKRTGKSCRLRWLNYLRPNVRRGNITLQEQLLILDLHSRYGNRWSKIAEHLPGRTDNEIKNYWRTRVVKQAKQLKCDVNSKQFRDTLRFVWMPRLLERIQASSAGTSSGQTSFSDNTQTQTTNPSVLSWSKPMVGVEAPSLSDSSVGYESMRGGGCSVSVENKFGLRQQMDSNMQAFEPCNGFELGADLWSDENIWFLQQQLADTDIPDGTCY